MGPFTPFKVRQASPFPTTKLNFSAKSYIINHILNTYLYVKPYKSCKIHPLNMLSHLIVSHNIYIYTHTLCRQATISSIFNVSDAQPSLVPRTIGIFFLGEHEYDKRRLDEINVKNHSKFCINGSNRERERESRKGKKMEKILLLHIGMERDGCGDKSKWGGHRINGGIHVTLAGSYLFAAVIFLSSLPLERGEWRRETLKARSHN